MKLTLLVKNTQNLYLSGDSSYTFDENGGSIGCENTKSDWQIQTNDNAINGMQAEVSFIDNAFCLISKAPAQISINGSQSPLEVDVPVQIRNGDFFKIGELMISVLSDEKYTFSGKPADNYASGMENMVSGEIINEDNTNYLDIIPPLGELSENQIKRGVPKDKKLDPLDALREKDHGLLEESNPLNALDKSSSENKSLLQNDIFKHIGNKENTETMYDGVNTGAANVMLNDINSKQQDHYFYDLDDMGSHKDNEEISEIDHVLLRPIFRAMGISSENFDITTHNDILINLGETVREAVSGLVNIYNSRQGEAHSFPLSNVTLHPIQDNPIRIAESTQDAIETLFIDQNPVHLHSSEAVRESLEHLNMHQSATEEAIDAGLESIITAFDPETLLKRFKKYARNKYIEEENLDKWAWKMYCLYHKEIKRQGKRGLQTLFWDVFGNVYDEYMRSEAKDV